MDGLCCSKAAPGRLLGWEGFAVRLTDHPDWVVSETTGPPQTSDQTVLAFTTTEEAA